MAEVKENEQYKITGEFEPGVPNYQCSKCQFATIYMPKMQKHWDEEKKHKHAWTFPSTGEPKPPTTGPTY